MEFYQKAWNSLIYFIPNTSANHTGDKINRTDENIPAHLLGNMWGQSWVNLYLDTQPFANSTVHDVTATMKAQHYNALKMFEISDEFYMSLGLPSNNMSYTGKSIIVKPTDRNQKSAPKIQCHASAWVSANELFASISSRKNEFFFYHDRTSPMAKTFASKCARVLMKKIWLLFIMKWVSIESLFTFYCLQSKLNFLALPPSLFL